MTLKLVFVLLPCSLISLIFIPFWRPEPPRVQSRALAVPWTQPKTPSAEVSLELPVPAPHDFVDAPVMDLQAPNSVEAVDKKLIDNWDLAAHGLDAQALAPFFTESQPESIVLYQDSEMTRIYPLRYALGKDQSRKTLFIGSEESIQNTLRERQERARSHRASQAKRGSPENNGDSPDGVRLPKNQYFIVFFKPGKTDAGGVFKPAVADFLKALQGPDYSFENVSSADGEAMQDILSRVLSLGHGGELMLGIKNNGFLADEPGFDFAIYENAFRIAGTKLIFQEFALVGVSARIEASSFRWFACDPLKKILRGCAGAVPTDEGGDQFDLSEIGLPKVRYIWIKDTGKNKNFSSRWPTEGVDLDGLRLNHAYREE